MSPRIEKLATTLILSAWAGATSNASASAQLAMRDPNRNIGEFPFAVAVTDCRRAYSAASDAVSAPFCVALRTSFVSPNPSGPAPNLTPHTAPPPPPTAQPR